jgi:hypothetical protein
MVVPEPGEPLLLYIAATSEAVSMVLVAEQPDPHNLYEVGSSSTDGSGSQDPGPAEELRAADGSGSQILGPVEEPGAADGSGSQDPGPAESRELPMGHGPKTRDMRKSRELTRQLGPSPRRPPLTPLTRQSWGPQDQSSRQAQRAGSSLGLQQWKWMHWTPPPRDGSDHPTSGVLHQRGPLRSQDKVHGGPQATLCSPHHL